MEKNIPFYRFSQNLNNITRTGYKKSLRYLPELKNIIDKIGRTYVRIEEILRHSYAPSDLDFTSFSLITSIQNDIHIILENLNEIFHDLLDSEFSDILFAFKSFDNNYHKVLKGKKINLIFLDTFYINYIVFSSILENIISKFKIRNVTLYGNEDDMAYMTTLSIYISTNDIIEANEFMYNITNTFKSVEGLKMRIYDTSVGSLKQDIILFFKNNFTRKKTEKFINDSFNSLKEKHIYKVSEEVAKMRKEREKLEVEIKKMENELLENEEAEKLNKLKIRKIEAEVRAIELDNEEKELNLEEKRTRYFKESISNNKSNIEISFTDKLALAKKIGHITRADEHAFEESIKKLPQKFRDFFA